MLRSLDIEGSVSKASDIGQDLIGGLGPPKGHGLSVVRIEKLTKFDRSMTSMQLTQDLAGFDIRCCKQRRGSAAATVMGATLRLPWSLAVLSSLVVFSRRVFVCQFASGVES
ncbi:MAG: hypothetical protein HY644_06105 [Acidobacteria bacterium]|nr:hypothetical protein [Acidobacteriota bacterium]